MRLSETDNALIKHLQTALGPLPARFGVAVSGGGDSIALLHLLAQMCRDQDKYLEAITVDHGLRPEAEEEAEFVRRQCSAMGVPHAIANWTRWSGEGNLQNEARSARYRLISEWAKRRKLAFVCLGHTRDDVAETFLMRLGRESGVDGLARMSDRFSRHDVSFRRPLLDVSRDELRGFLRHHKIDWKEDPSNTNEAFDRVRARKALEVLKDMGLTAENLSKVALQMTDARDVLRGQVLSLARDCVTQLQGDLLLRREDVLDASPETRRRLLSACIKWVAQSNYTPRRGGVAELDEAISEKRSFALGGCLITVNAKTLRIAREYNAVRDLTEHSPQWDRWVLEGPWMVGMELKPLGEPSVAGLKDWRMSELPRRSLMSSPAVWYGGALVAAPLAGYGEDWVATLRGRDFMSSLRSDCII